VKGKPCWFGWRCLVLGIVFTVIAGTAGAAASEIADKIGARLKKAFEEQFGALEGGAGYERKQIFGTVVGFNYHLKEGKLQDGWTTKAQDALKQLGIEAEASRSEVRAEDQMIEGKKFLSLQVTRSRGSEEGDSLGVSILLAP